MADINGILLIISCIACLGLAGYAFYMYSLTQSDPIFILGTSLSTIATSILFGYLNVVRFGDMILNVSWLWYPGSSIGLLFLFLISVMKTNEQIRLLRRWQVFATLLFILLILLSPTFPPSTDPLVPALLNLARPLICVCAFLRYVSLYLSKETRFCLVMSLAFLVLGVGFGMVTPQLLDPGLAMLGGLGSILRIVGYSTMISAYTLLK
jgi:hypothetical protein